MTKITNTGVSVIEKLEFEYYPSTWLRVVSLPNHLGFVIWCLEFLNSSDPIWH